MAREPGDKVGPRLAQLVANYTIAARRQLAPVEARMHAAASWHNIDRAGREIADMLGPYARLMLDADQGQLSGHTRAMLADAGSGRHQAKALGGLLMGPVAGTLGTIISNELAPVAYALVGGNPQLNPDPGSLAAGAAAGLISRGEQAQWTHQQGFQSVFSDMLYGLAQQVPDVAALLDLLNRGLITEAETRSWLRRAGFDPSVIAHLIATREQLVSPADLALGVLRGNVPEPEAVAEAARQGVSPRMLKILELNTGEPPGLEEMIRLFRYGEITAARLTEAILQSRVRNEWIPEVLKLAVVRPSGPEILSALVQGQIPEPEARSRFTQAGGDPSWFDTAFHSTAESPTPVQLSEMANRGIIPWTGAGPLSVTFEQGVREGRWKDKWLPAFRELAVYEPPPREIATLAREGGLTEDQALKLWEKHGLTPEMAHLYWKAAHFTRTAKARDLAAGEIERLYFDQAISKAEAHKMLLGLGDTKEAADFRIELTDLRRERSYLERAISKISTLYVAWKITGTQAGAALAELEVGSAEAGHLLRTWTLERSAAARQLTPGEIAGAVHYQVLSVPEGMTALERIGYSPFDAWVLLSVREHAALPGRPAR